MDALPPKDQVQFGRQLAHVNPAMENRPLFANNEGEDTTAQFGDMGASV